MSVEAVIIKRYSPALHAFEVTPFRVLRLPVSATTAQAAFEGERVLTLAQAEMSPDLPDPLPWLPAPGFPELQQATQIVEEPLLRLKSQLLWFDFEHDARAVELAAALRARDEQALQEYFDHETVLPVLAQPSPGAEVPEARPKLHFLYLQKLREAKAAKDWAAAPSPEVDATLQPPDHGLVAQAVNQANARLLVATARMNFVMDGNSGASGIRPFAPKSWRSFGALRGLPDVQAVLAGQLSDDDGEIRKLWEGALVRWKTLLAHPWFAAYLAAGIEALHDDFATVDDTEALEESIGTALADLSAQETRFLLLEGRYATARALIASIAGSGFEARVLTPAMRPVRQLFQSELAEIDPFLDKPQDSGFEPLAACLKRLTQIRDRWVALDEHGVVGLRDLVDGAVERVYLRLRQWHKPEPQADSLLEQAGGIASAQSLKERIETLRADQQERRERICEFCKQNDPDYDYSVVLEGKKETGRTRSFNKTTIHQAITYQLMLRCKRCAKYHEFIRKIAAGLTVLTIAAIIGIGFLWLSAI